MALWGNTDADESKPKWLTAESKVNNIDNCFADERGWVYRHYKNAEKTEYWDEVLATVSGLATDIGGADIVAFEFITTSVSAASPDEFSVRVRFNEKVNVVTTGGTPTLTITNTSSGTGTDFDLDYASGSGGFELVFTGTWTTEFEETDVLSIGENAITLNSGTITDASGTASNAVITNSAALGAAAGTITVDA